MQALLNPYARVGLVWLGMVLIWLSLGSLRRLVWGDDYLLTAHLVSALLATLLAVPLVVLARRRLDGGRLDGLGLVLNGRAVKPFLVGALAFLLPCAVALGVLLGAGWVSITPVAAWADILLFVPLLVGLVLLYESLPEELAFRGYLYTNLAARLSPLAAVIVQAVLFACWGATLWALLSGSILPGRLLMFFFIALVLGLLRVLTGSVWVAIGLHTAMQTSAQLLLNAERGHFEVAGSGLLQLLALGVVPFSLALTIVGFFYRSPPDWLGRKQGI